MHLTARSYAVLCAVALCGIAAQWGAAWLAEVWRGLAASLLLLLVYEALHTRRQPLACVRELAARLHLGKAAPLTVHLHNPTGQTLAVQVMQPLPVTLRGPQDVLHYTLAAGGDGSQSVQVVPSALGELAWQDVHLRVRGMLGLAWWERRLAVPGQHSVVPDSLTSAERHRASGGSGAIAGTQRGQGFELLGLRPYVPGDPLRTLDWKATARSQQSWVRIFAQDERLELLLMLDTSRLSALPAGDLSRLARYVNVAARLAEYAQRHGNAVGLLSFSDEVHEQLRPSAAASHLPALRAALGRARPRAVEASLLQAALQARHLLGQRSLVVIFTDLDVEDRGGQWLEGIALLSARHLPLLASVRDEALEQQRKRAAQAWRDPYDVLAALEIDQASRANQARARRLGARVICARAADLDRAVLAGYDDVRARRRV